MRGWYERYYGAIGHSAAYGEFCRRVFGRDLGQHGFADMEQAGLLVQALELQGADRVLDLGCGTGGMIAAIAADSGVAATGIDYVETAAAAAQRRYGGPRMGFVTGDIGALCFAPGSFDAAISVDTLYFTPIDETVAAIAGLLSPGGRMGILYSHGANPENPLETFDHSELAPERTPLGVALRAQGLPFIAQDLTDADRRHAMLKKSVLEELETSFILEGNEFLYENRYSEANGVLTAIDAGAHARYLYIVKKPVR